MKKLLPLLLVLAMIAAVFTGCSGSSITTGPSTAEKPSTTAAVTTAKSLLNLDSLVPVVNEPVTVSLGVMVSETSGKPEDLWFWDYLEKITGVHFEFTAYLDSAWSEKKTVVMAGGDYPEAFFIPGAFSSNEIYKYGKEGIFIALNDYIEDYMPSMIARTQEFPAMLPTMTCPDGNIYALAETTDVWFPYSGNYNVKWRDAAGSTELPTTLDEFYELLKSYKELGDVNGDGIDNEYPWTGSWKDNSQNRMVILNGFGILTNGNLGPGIGIEDNEASYFPMSDKYREYLEYMNKLYTEKLVDPDIFTLTNTECASKVQIGTVGFLAANAMYLSGAVDTYKDWEIMIPLAPDENTEPAIFKNSSVTNPAAYITDACKNPEVVCRWLNLFFEKEYCMLQFGPDANNPDHMEGWEDTDVARHIVETKPASSFGDYVWSFGDLDPDTVIANFTNVGQPEGVDWVTWMNDKAVPLWGRFGDSFLMGMSWYFYDAIGSIPEFWGNDAGEGYWRKQMYERGAQYAIEGYPAYVFYTDEQTEFINTHKTPLQDYVTSMEAKFITGAISFDEFDNYIAELDKLGANEYNEIISGYYENYKKNK